MTETDKLKEAIRRLADQDATLSVCGGDVTVMMDGSPQWIPVSERFPEDSQEVIVWLNAEDVSTAHGLEGWNEVAVYSRGHFGTQMAGVEVTHWMPAPPPPGSSS